MTLQVTELIQVNGGMMWMYVLLGPPLISVVKDLLLVEAPVPSGRCLKLRVNACGVVKDKMFSLCGFATPS